MTVRLTGLRNCTEPLTGNESLPLDQQLAWLAGEVSVAVASALKTSGDPAGTGRHNLTVLGQLAVKLAQTAEAALREEQS